MPRSSKSSLKDFEPKRKNTISLGSDSNIDNDFKAFKIGDVPTGLEFKLGEIRSTADNFITLNETTEQLTVTKIKGSKSGSVEVPQIIMQHPDATDVSIGLWFNIMTSGTSIIQAGATDTDIVLKSSRNLFLYTGEDDGDCLYVRRGDEWLSGYTTALKFDPFNTDLYIYDKTNANDYFKIDVGAEGATTLSTVDADTTAGHLTLDVDGSIILDPADGKFIAKNNGTEFSATDSAYAGMILGYTRLEGDLTNQNSYEIQNAITVEDDTHQITFITPPSEYVEIEVSCFIDIGSTDTKIAIGLSSANATSGYSALSGELEYDTAMFSDDEVDDDMLSVKFVCKASHLASIGSSNTFYIGFSTGGSTKTTYLRYGYRASHGTGYPPFIIKATALPATIYDGT